MDKKIGRTQTKLDSVKDRGDLRKISTKENTETNTKQLSDRGDTVHKSKINIKLVTNPSYVINDEKTSIKTSDKDENTKRDQAIRQELVKKIADKTKKFENQTRTYLDLEGRRRLRERYTLKFNNQKDSVKNEVKIEKENDSDKEEKKSVGEYSKPNNSVKSVKSEKRKEAPTRKPIIKTITIKNDNKVYKAVTFTDQETHTPLQIKLPTNLKKKVSKSTETNFKCLTPCAVTVSPSKVSIKEKPEKSIKKEKKRKRVLSPEVASNHGNSSPTTEVAKWAPFCLNDHTKPYYEAWVNTTLTAISKCTDAEKEEIYKSLRIGEYKRPSTPELFYENFNDERYTGTIKIKTKRDVVRIE